MSEAVHNIDPVQPEKKKPSLFKIITSPAEQFSRMKENPTVALPLLIVTAVFAVFGGIFAYTTDFQTLIGDVPADEAVFIEAAEGIMRLTTFISMLFIPVIGSLFAAFVMWIAAKITAGEATFKQLFSLNVFVNLLTGIGLLVNLLIILAFGLDPLQTYTGLTVFFDPLDQVFPLVAMFEVFGIWLLILTVIGLRIVVSMSPAAAWITALIIYAGGSFIAYLSAGL
ncbi:YIP1 family protein [Bacillus sp. H-16]|uniref:YIP1 family protein n=1 Tax=Alteribacter salitolerans TaxID=2912333 RepID=UPI001966BEAF|nr:YIP1 family protein [Alteribacter salitolerans]MBM7096022.1 YIP1 family protein [Alteribacter salitolerans]